MTQRNLTMTQSHRLREQTCGCRGWGRQRREGWEFGVADANYHRENG